MGASGGAPVFYRSQFKYEPQDGVQPILRVLTAGLSRGFVWLNGHNLGRYPEKIPLNGIYLPECWLNTGDNSLVIFDEAGNSNSQVALTVETGASRQIATAVETARKGVAPPLTGLTGSSAARQLDPVQSN